MLIRDDGDTWTAIGQPAHAWLAGQIARAWDPAPPEAVLLGIEQHDIVWSEWDRRPGLHAPEGRAAAFFELAAADQPSWAGVADRLVVQNPHAGLLVSLHGTNIMRRYRPPEFQDADYLASETEAQDALLAQLGMARADAEREADFLFAVDALSLSLCFGWPERELPPIDGTVITYRPLGEGEGAGTAGTTGRATLDPWPLAVDELEVRLLARTLTERFDDEAALHAALEAAPWTELTWRLRSA